MKVHMTTFELETSAEKALMATLRLMSGVTLINIQRASPGNGRPAGILARIDVLGHGHTLVCAVERDGELAHVRADLRDFAKYTAHLTDGATPVIIAPFLSSEAKAACKEADAGFLDLEGNARLSVGEVFICERSLPHRAAVSASALTLNSQAGIFPLPRFRQRYNRLGIPAIETTR